MVVCTLYAYDDRDQYNDGSIDRGDKGANHLIIHMCICRYYKTLYRVRVQTLLLRTYFTNKYYLIIKTVSAENLLVMQEIF